MKEMAGRVSPEMRRGIIERYSAGNISRAQLARENGISVSTVNRILKEAVAVDSGIKGKEAVKPDQGNEKHGIYDEYIEYLASNGISREDLIRIISELKEVEARFSSSSEKVPQGEVSGGLSDYVFMAFSVRPYQMKDENYIPARFSANQFLMILPVIGFYIIAFSIIFIPISLIYLSALMAVILALILTRKNYWTRRVNKMVERGFI